MKLSERLAKDGLISSEELPVVAYGLRSLRDNVLSFIITVGIGFVFQDIVSAILFFFFCFPLRRSAGGYHAQTRVRCLLFSTGLLLSMWTSWEYMRIFQNCRLVASIFSTAILFILVPAETHNKKLDPAERAVYGRRARRIAFLELFLCFISFHMKWNLLFKSTALSLYTSSIAVLAGKWVMRK